MKQEQIHLQLQKVKINSGEKKKNATVHKLLHYRAYH